MSIADKLTRFESAREDIIDALSDKGVIATNHGFEDFPDDILAIQAEGGSVISIQDSVDPVHGGTIRTITAVNLAGDTVTESVLLNGYTAHDEQGNPITGEYVPPSPSLQQKTVSPTESQILVEPDSGYDGLEDVTVNAISSSYVGSGVTRRDSTDLSASGNTVTAPAGYYESSASKAVASGTVTAPSTISGTSATVSTGTNTLTLSKTVSVTPSVTTAGYVSSGTAGNSSVSLTANVTTQAAQTIHPSTSDQTIASGRYLTGNQTIKAVTVSGLSASNILSGVTVKIGDSTDDDCVASVSGNVSFQTIYIGSGPPSSSLGVDGDIYIQT